MSTFRYDTFEALEIKKKKILVTVFEQLSIVVGRGNIAPFSVILLLVSAVSVFQVRIS